MRSRDLSRWGRPCGPGPACGPRPGRGLFWNVVLATCVSYHYRRQEIQGVLIVRCRNHLGLTGHFGPAAAAAGSCANPPFQEQGWGRGRSRGGAAGRPAEECGGFSVRTHKCTYRGARRRPGLRVGGAQTRLSPRCWKHVAGPVCWGRRQSLRECWLWRPTTSGQTLAPSLTGCAT